MTIFSYGSIPEPPDNSPDLAWDYATLWRNLGEVEKLTSDLRALVSQQEERSPAIEAAIDERLALIKAVLDATIHGVPL